MRSAMHYSRGAVVVLSLAATTALAAKPPRNPPPPPPVPVSYQIEFWSIDSIAGASLVLDIYDTNNARQTVGSCVVDTDGDGVFESVHGYLYDPGENAALGVDLNDIVSNIPDGWSIRKATAMNEVGQITAYIEPIGAPLEQLESVMIDMNEITPVLYRVPDRDFTSYSLPGDINDWGDIVVRYRRGDGTFGNYVYNFDPGAGIQVPLDLGIVTTVGRHPRINNAREVVGSLGDGDAYRSTWNGPFEVFPELTPWALNEGGAFCGSGRDLSGKGKTKTFNYAFVYGSSLELLTQLPLAYGLNESRDVVFGGNLSHRNNDGTSTLYVLLDLLDPNDPVTATIVHESDLYCHTMTDREITTGFPVLTGNFNSNGVGFQLIPVAAP